MATQRATALCVIFAVSTGIAGIAGYSIGVRQTTATAPPVGSPATNAGGTDDDFSRDTPCPVVRVVDGDPLALDVRGRVERPRLLGVDPPETVHPGKPVEFYGRE